MENSGRRLQVRLGLEQDGEYKTAQNLQEVETVVNYSTPARSPWMLYPRVKTVPRVLWAGLTDGVKMYSMWPLCVCVCVLYFRSGKPCYWRLQVYQDHLISFLAVEMLHCPSR